MSDTPGRTAWRLIFADTAEEISRLEAAYGRTQQQTVDEFIEDSCWSDWFPGFIGHKGTAEDRRASLRAAYIINVERRLLR